MDAPLTEVLWRRSCWPLGVDDPETLDGFAGGRVFAILVDEYAVAGPSLDNAAGLGFGLLGEA